MTNLFLYGTLRHLPLLELVSGQPEQALKLSQARLEGYRAVWAKGLSFPLIETASGAVADGLLLRDVDATMLERLNYYELSFGYDLIDVVVAAGGETVPAQIYFPRPGLWQGGAAFSLEDWVRDWWGLTRHSACEVMGYLGQLSGAEVSRRFAMIQTRAAARHAAETEITPTGLRRATGADQVELRREELSHAGFFLAKTLWLRHPLFRGGLSAEVEREVFIAGDAAILLPYDPVRDRVLLVEQFRLGPYARGDLHPWALEPVAGRIDGGETAEQAARREAREEAHITLHSLEKIASYYPTPGYSSEYFHSFLGLADLPDGIAGVGGLDSEHEDIRAHVIGFEAAMALVTSGEANIGPLILSLLWLERERPRLRAAAGA